MSRLYLKALLASISTLLSLAILEALARRLPDSQRILFVPSKLPRVAYQLAPDSVAKYGPYEYHIDSWGFHYPEIPQEKPAGYFRIFGLGDSILFGQNTGKDDLSQSLEEKLNAKPPRAGIKRWQVVNTGVPGYNTCQEAALLEGLVSRFKPDLVMVAYCMNDPEGTHAPFGMDVEHGTMPVWWRAYHFVKGRIVLLKYVVQKASPLITRLRGRSEYAPPVDLSQEVRYAAALHDPRGPYWATAAKCLAAFGEYGKKTGVPVLVVIFPLLNHLDAPELESAYERVERAARDAGAAALNLYPYFKSLPAADLARFKGDGIHPTEDGHRFAAKVVYDYLMKHPEWLTPR